MKHRLISLTVSGTTVAAALVLAATTAFASAPRVTTWTVSPGGAIAGALNTGTTAVLQDTTAGVPVTCKVSSAKGSVKAGKGQSGTGIGSITSATWGSTSSKCAGPLGSTFTATGSASTTKPWKLNAVSYKPTVDGGQTVGTLTAAGTGVGATLHGSALGVACTTVVGGTTAAPARANALYDNTSGVLAITGTVNLKVLSSNCPLVKAGDKVTFMTSPVSVAGKAATHGYKLSPKQKITSP